MAWGAIRVCKARPFFRASSEVMKWLLIASCSSSALHWSAGAIISRSLQLQETGARSL